MSDRLAKIIVTICTLVFILAIVGTIIAFAVKAWLVVEGIRAIDSMGGLAGIFEKILQLFS